MTRRALTTLLLTTFLMSGCGTFADIMAGPANGQVYYRGVSMDMDGIKEGGAMTLLVFDLPFSAVADTVLVPVHAYYQLTERPAGSQSLREDEAMQLQRQTAPSTYIDGYGWDNMP
jgi:uncharacterized protein YceK